MSQYPDPGQTPQYPQQYPQQSPTPYNIPGYYSGGNVMGNRRPGAVTAVAITGIILGSLSVLCTGPSFFLNLAMLGNGGKNPLAPQLAAPDHSVVVFSVFQTLINFLMSLIMLVCCIAALGLRRWARSILVPWSYAMIGWAVVVCYLTITWIAPETQKMIRSAMPPSAMTPAMQQGQQIGQYIGAIFTAGLMCVVPICVLLLWGRPAVRSAFGDPAYQSPTSHP